MAVGNDYSFGIDDINLDDLDDFPGDVSGFVTDCWESQLCVPPDPIENLDWFPCFTDDSISLNGLDLVSSTPPTLGRNSKPPDHDCESEEKEQQIKQIFDNGQVKTTVTKSRILSLFSISKSNKKARTRKGTDSKSAGKNKAEALWGAGIGMKGQKEKRRCSHCLTEKTPQWRAGPNGPNTLCNACGIRNKSGRLLAEYRPAASPTFDSCKHSNFHKRVLNMKLQG